MNFNKRRPSGLFRFVTSCLVFLGLTAAITPVQAAIERERSILDSRVASARRVIQDTTQIRVASPAGALNKLAQWGNWGNWPNWNNWGNWGNWPNWFNR